MKKLRQFLTIVCLFAGLSVGVLDRAVNAQGQAPNPGSTLIALTDGSTISVPIPGKALIYTYTLTITGNHTLGNPTGLIAGQILNFVISQNGTGNNVISFGSYYVGPNQTILALNTGANTKTVINCIADTSTTLQCTGGSVTGGGGGVQALSSDGMVDSIGINLHLTYSGSQYDVDFSTVASLLATLGVRHARDTADIANALTHAETLTGATYGGGAGISYSLNSGGYGAGLGGGPTPATVVSNIEAIGAAHMDDVEGNNEPDAQGDGNWPADTLANQIANWNAVRAATPVQNVPFAGPSIIYPSASGNPSGNDGPPPSGILSYMNYINIHRYQATNGGATYPEQDTPVVLSSWYAAAYGLPIPQPVLVTESGAYGSAQSGWATPGPNMNYATQAQYTPRFLMSNYAAGILRTYDYELVDDDLQSGYEAQFGIVQSNMTPKPAFYAIENLISLLADPGAPFTPGSLQYTLGGNGTNNVQSVLLGKRDGSFILSLVQGVSTWNSTTFTAISPPSPNSVTITLPAGSPMGHYQTATLSTTATQNTWSTLTPISGGVVTVSVTPSITLVRLAP